MKYEAPLRCISCGMPIKKKPKAKMPKYCPRCRERQQDQWKEQVRNSRQRRVRGQ